VEPGDAAGVRGADEVENPLTAKAGRRLDAKRRWCESAGDLRSAGYQRFMTATGSGAEAALRAY
jgi:hypothetical protein